MFSFALGLPSTWETNGGCKEYNLFAGTKIARSNQSANGERTDALPQHYRLRTPQP